jgi:hypothetical protein
VDEAGRLIVGTSASLKGMAAADPRYAAVFAGLPPGITPPRPVDSLPVWVARPSGAIADTIAMLSTANRVLILPVSGGVDGSGTGRVEWLVRFQPLLDHPLLRASPTGSLLVVERPAEQGHATPPRYLLRVFEPDGRVVAIHSLPYVPDPVPSGWTDSTIATLADQLVERGQDRTIATETASRMLYQPGYLPAVSAARMGPDGWIWLQRYGLAEEGEREWEIVDAAGQRVGVVSLDARFDPAAVHGRTAWVTVTEGSELPRILRIEAR